MRVEDRLIVALDVETYEQASGMVDALKVEVGIFKVGIAPFTSFGERIMDKLSSLGKKIFLDLKVHDIPNTARNAAKAAAEKNVFMMNFHCMGSEAMMTAAREGAEAGRAGGPGPILLGVTVLTSMDKKALESLGFDKTVEEQVMDFAHSAKNAGFDGVVASANEAEKIKKVFGKDIVVVTPGIRPRGSREDDQKRVTTPLEALRKGADYIVVGRPIIEAKDPKRAAEKILEEMREYK
ncbi:MAG: orotidine-5'-phosphate decarboxylase [Candidatus Omnitrophota bacterium]